MSIVSTESCVHTILLRPIPRFKMGLPDAYAAGELLQRILQLGISAVGQLLAHASVQVEVGEFDQDTVEALGWLLAELGDAAAACVELAAPCRRATADFTGRRHG